MTTDEIAKLVTSNVPAGAKAYRLVQERAGCLYYVPSQDAPPLCLSPFELGGVPPGVYGVLFVDGAKEFVLKTPINVVVESLFPVVHASAAAPLAMEAAEVGHSLEIEKLNADTLMVRGGAQAFNDNLAFYANFQRALGLHSAASLRIENERIELMAKSVRTMLATQAEMHEASRQQLEKNKTPPPPPNWENIVAAGAPALAAMYTATIAAITKTAPVKVSGTAEPLAPESEKLKVIYEALGNFSSKERLEAMLKDERKLKEWMKMVQGLIKDEAADQEPTDAE
ncbi:MAG TPA: hypothetical protein PKX75_21070 [Nitrospira sp.]|jgi:hypothetical protein|nr:hypothetical protein [Nitrospira sp.]